MTTRYEWVKLFLDNWKIITSVVAFVISSFFGVYNNMEKEDIISATQRQVTEHAKAYAEVFKTPKLPVSPRVVEKHYIESCTQCAKLIHQNNVKYHGAKP